MTNYRKNKTFFAKNRHTNTTDHHVNTDHDADDSWLAMIDKDRSTSNGDTGEN